MHLDTLLAEALSTRQVERAAHARYAALRTGDRAERAEARRCLLVAGAVARAATAAYVEAQARANSR